MTRTKVFAPILLLCSVLASGFAFAQHDLNVAALETGIAARKTEIKFFDTGNVERIDKVVGSLRTVKGCSKTRSLRVRVVRAVSDAADEKRVTSLRVKGSARGSKELELDIDPSLYSRLAPGHVTKLKSFFAASRLLAVDYYDCTAAGRRNLLEAARHVN